MSTASGFVWYELVTNGVDAAATFYADVVRWDVRDSGMPGIKYLMFGKDGKDVGGIMDWSMTGGSGKPAWMAHIHTPEVDAEVERVVKDGGRVVRPATDIQGVGRFAVMLDPQGATFMLFQPGSAYAPSRLGQNDLGNVGWHELITSDWESAWQFYSGHFGWQKDFAMDMKELGTYQTFRTITERYTGAMMTTPPFVPDKTPKWLLYFTVDDVDAGAERIKAAGGTVIHGPMDVPGGSRMVQAIDPQGGMFALTTPQTKAPGAM